MFSYILGAPFISYYFFLLFSFFIHLPLSIQTSLPFGRAWKGLLFYSVHHGYQIAQGDESTRRQHKKQDIVGLGQQREAEDGT